MTNWIIRFLGLHEKKQAQKTQEVSDYVHNKTNEYQNEMLQLQYIAKQTHQQAKNLRKNSEKIVQLTNDITGRLAIVTSKRRMRHG